MTETEKLIKEAREFIDRRGVRRDTDLIVRLTDALEEASSREKRLRFPLFAENPPVTNWSPEEAAAWLKENAAWALSDDGDSLESSPE